ncbi:hypothetical protein E2C01_051234 [Portunus trituberculatus]|uniref:Uncharacterized protein n=1 Tax=Portunus trituberculatus TaxID=210409 RepID=A0A5B7GI39_PORTR|nr:hypothetical protein [Portunus trituberculatus]
MVTDCGVSGEDSDADRSATVPFLLGYSTSSTSSFIRSPNHMHWERHGTLASSVPHFHIHSETFVEHKSLQYQGTSPYSFY